MKYPPEWREREFLDWLHSQPCVVSGYIMSELGGPGVDPAHTRFGLYGRGMKPPPWHAQPLRHELHLEQGATTEPKFWRKRADDHLLMDAIKAHGERRYLHWAQDKGMDLNEVARWMRER